MPPDSTTCPSHAWTRLRISGGNIDQRALAEHHLGFEQAHTSEIHKSSLLGGKVLDRGSRDVFEPEVRDGLFRRDGATRYAREEAQVGMNRIAVEPLIGFDVEGASPVRVCAMDETDRAIGGIAATFDMHALVSLAFEQLLYGAVIRHFHLLRFVRLGPHHYI